MEDVRRNTYFMTSIDYETIDLSGLPDVYKRQGEECGTLFTAHENKDFDLNTYLNSES